MNPRGTQLKPLFDSGLDQFRAERNPVALSKGRPLSFAGVYAAANSSLRPLPIVASGSALAGIAFAAVVCWALPESRNLTGLSSGLLIGAVMGLIWFGSLAGIMAVSDKYSDWINRCSNCLNWHTSMAMAVSLGYLFACDRLGGSDHWTTVASWVVSLGALIKIGLCEAMEARTDRAG